MRTGYGSEDCASFGLTIASRKRSEASDCPLRVGWPASPGFFGPIDPEVVTTVKAAAQALSGAGCQAEEVRLPVLEQTDGVSILWKLQEMESRPEFDKITAGHEAEVFRHLKLIFDTPETPIADFVFAEQTVERLRDTKSAMPR